MQSSNSALAKKFIANLTFFKFVRRTQSAVPQGKAAEDPLGSLISAHVLERRAENRSDVMHLPLLQTVISLKGAP